MNNTLRPGRGCIQVIDELGLPIKNADVKVRLASGRELELATDDQGKVWPELAEGDEATLFLGDYHEVADQDSARTDSGQHFAANQTGPASERGSA